MTMHASPTATAAGDLFQARAFGVSPLGSLATLGAEGDAVPGADPTAPGDRLLFSGPLSAGQAVVGVLSWSAPAAIGGAVTGLVAASSMHGAQQGALWAGGGAALVSGLAVATVGRQPVGWLLALGGVSLAGLAAYRAWRK